MSLYWIDLADGKVTKIASEPHFGPWGFWRLQPAWSPDSKWIAYNLGNKAAYRTVYVHNLADNKSTAVTDGLSRLRRSRLRCQRQVSLPLRPPPMPGR